MIGHLLRAGLVVISKEITLIPINFSEVSLKLKDIGGRNEEVVCIFDSCYISFVVYWM